jgi:hypothetical protein
MMRRPFRNVILVWWACKENNVLSPLKYVILWSQIKDQGPHKRKKSETSRQVRGSSVERIPYALAIASYLSTRKCPEPCVPSNRV